MPGQTDNPNILAAANQIVVALNEIAGKISDLPSNSDLLETIGDNIDLHRVGTESGLTAIIAAIGDNGTELQTSLGTINTTISEGLTALDTTVGDRLTATNSNLIDINGTMEDCCTGMQQYFGLMVDAIRNIRLQPSSGNGGSDTGGPFLDEPEIDTGDPGYDPPPDEYKCKASNYIFDYIWYMLGVFSGLNSYRATITEVAAIAIISPIVLAQGLAVLTGVGLPAAVAAGILEGLVYGVVTVFNWRFFIYFEDLRNELEDNREDLICQLYQAAVADSKEGVKAAINNFIADVMDGIITIDHGLQLTLRHQQAIDYVLRRVVYLLASNFLINKLFEVSPVVEVYAGEMYDIGPMQSCGDCEEPGDTGVYDFTISEYNWELEQTLCLPVSGGVWTAGQGYQASTGQTSSTARVVIDQQVTHSVDNVRVTFSCSGFIRPNFMVYSADALAGPYSQAGPTIQGGTGTYQILEATNLSLVDKYIRVAVEQFQNYPYVTLHRVEYFED